jgi:hypothetical protein
MAEIKYDHKKRDNRAYQDPNNARLASEVKELDATANAFAAQLTALVEAHRDREHLIAALTRALMETAEPRIRTTLQSDGQAPAVLMAELHRTVARFVVQHYA